MIRANERMRPVLGIVLLAALALFAISSLGAPQSGGFASSEVQFTDNSARGMQIVPASCPSSPHWLGQCDGTPPPPSQNGCTISVEPSGITAGTVTRRVGDAAHGIRSRAPDIPPSVPSPGIGPVARTGSLTVNPSQTTIYTYSGTYNARSLRRRVHSGLDLLMFHFCCGLQRRHRLRQLFLHGDEIVLPTAVGQKVRQYARLQCMRIRMFRERMNSSPPAPTGALSARPLLVRADETVNIVWSADFVNSCTVTGTNGDRWETRTGNETSGPITQQTIYTLSCEGVDGSTLTQQVTVNIVPVFQEASAARAYSAAAGAPLAQAQSNDELKDNHPRGITR